MLAGDTVISGDPEPDKNPTATLVRDGTQGTEERLRKVEALALHVPECCLPPTPQASETSRWSGPSPEDPAPLTGRGSGAKSMRAEMSPPCTRDVAVPPTDVNPCPQGAPVSVENQCKVAT